MNRRKLTLVAMLLFGLLAVNAAQFSMNLYYTGTAPAEWNLNEYHLRFGLGSANDLVPLPPVAVVPNFAWFEGPGDITVSTTGNDDVFSKLGEYIKADADAALWQLYVRDSMKITFVLAAGSVPAGAVLKIYPEGAEDEAVEWTDGMVLDAKANTTYLIDYRKTASTTKALGTPPVKQVQMRRGTTSLVIDFDIPEGCSLKGDSNVLAFSRSVEARTTVYNALDGTYGKFNAGTKTLTMSKMTNVDQIRFNYWFTDGTRTSEKAIVFVDVTDSLMTSLVKKTDAATGTTYSGSVVAVDPDEEGYAGTVLTYKIELDNATVGKALTLKVRTPKFTPDADAYAVQYYFTNSEDGAGSYLDLPEDGAVYTATSATIYLKVKATLTGKCDAGDVVPSITPANGEEIEMESVYMTILSGGTLDIDGNGEITEDDAIMMYNFIVLGGVDDPMSMYEDDIIQGVTGEVDATAALAVLRSLAAFLDYDGNGTISDDDAIMMYNFIVLGGIDDPDSMYEEDIIQGVSGEVDAATALANFKAYAKKN